MKKIGVLTLPTLTNYGGILQAYALVYVLKKMGYDGLSNKTSELPVKECIIVQFK